MTKKLLCLLLALAMLLGGCVYRSVGDEGSGPAVYRISTSGSGGKLVRENVKLREGDVLSERIVEQLNAEAIDISCLSAFPAGVEIVDLSIEKGIARVEMSEGYAALEGLDKLLADTAVVLSLMCVDEICRVDMTCGGKTLAERLAAEDIVQHDGICGSFVRTLKLYLPDDGRSALRPKSISVSDDGRLSSAERILEALLGALGEDMAATEILSVSTEDGVCRVDLSEEFYGAEPADSYEGMLLIYSIINSLCRVPGVDAVVISVEGYTVESYGGFRIIWPLGGNMSLVSYD